MNALAIRDTDEIGQWQVIREQAGILLKSGFLPQSIKTPEAALAIILTGRELGIGTMQAFNTINIIAGKPTTSPQLMLALINRTKELENLSITDDGQACAVTMTRKGRKPHTETFSMKDAASMKTTEYIGGEKKTISLSEKYNWKQMPAVMRKWRAVAACARVVFPDVILGLYTPEEMGAAVSEEGDVIDLPVEATAGAVIVAEAKPLIGENEREYLINKYSETTTIEEEPEPAESSMSLADEAPDDPRAQLRWLAWKLGYEDKNLLKWLTTRYKLDKGLKINEALISLGDGELQEAIGIFNQHVEAAKAKEAA